MRVLIKDKLINMKDLINSIGFILIVGGLGISVLNNFFCRNLCVICSIEQISPCFFLFLFSGILLIVSGASLIIENKK